MGRAAVLLADLDCALAGGNVGVVMVCGLHSGAGRGLTSGPEDGAKARRVREVGSLEAKASTSTLATISPRLLAAILVRTAIGAPTHPSTASRARVPLKVIVQGRFCRGRRR